MEDPELVDQAGRITAGTDASAPDPSWPKARVGDCLLTPALARKLTAGRAELVTIAPVDPRFDQPAESG